MITSYVEELDLNKLSPLLLLKYHSLPDAMTKLGKPEEINQLFTGFQKHLYTNRGFVYQKHDRS